MIRFQFAVYKYVFAARQVSRQAVSALDIWHELDLRDFESSQIHLGHTVIRLIVDPEPFSIVLAARLAQHRMMRVAPHRSGLDQPLISGRTRIIGVAQSRARLENRNFLDETAGRDAIHEHAAALTTTQNRVVIIELSGRNVDLLRRARVLRRRLFLFAAEITSAAAQSHSACHGRGSNNKY